MEVRCQKSESVSDESICHYLNGFHSTKYIAKLSCIWPINTRSETEIGNAQILCRVFSFLSPQIRTGYEETQLREIIGITSMQHKIISNGTSCVPKCMSCHKAIVMIARRAHYFHNIMLYI